MAITFSWFRNEPTSSRIVLAISGLLFLISLVFDAYTFEAIDFGIVESHSMPALLALLTGWGNVSIPPSLAWYANPIGIAGLVLISQKRYTVAVVVSVVALLCAVSFLFEADVLVDEAGNSGRILSVGTAYWLWLGAMIALTTGAGIAYLNRRLRQ